MNRTHQTLIRQSVTRRRFLSGALAVGAGAAVAACGAGSSSGSSSGKMTLQYWNLFGGGDGARMVELVNGFNKSQKDIQVRATTLTWGTPYYTKLTTSTIAGQAPDVAIMHLSRMASFAPTGIITEIDSGLMSKHGLTADQFSPKPWQMAHSNGQLMAIPLDTHPMVMYYNKTLAQKAGLLGSDGLLKPITGAGALVSAFKSTMSAGAKWGLAIDTEDVNPCTPSSAAGPSCPRTARTCCSTMPRGSRQPASCANCPSSPRSPGRPPTTPPQWPSSGTRRPGSS
jgi:multiple sugar transport system substrate-binding protein